MGGLCPEESLRSPEEGEFFPTNFMQLMMTLGLDGIKLDGTKMDFRKSMLDTTVDALIVDLLHWLAARDRTYPEVIDVWRTSCPRLPVWEDAKDRGFVRQENFDGRELVRITPAGFAFLEERSKSPINARKI
jgi:D-3-phosphoglycerate dehydrogenase